MKHKAFRWIPAVLLAAALLAGCGAASSQMTREEGSIAGPPVKTESALPVSTPEADTAPEPENGTETPQELPPLDQRVTNQWEIHKNLQDPAGKVLCLNMEVPRINSASADAARTYLLFWLAGDIDGAESYLHLFCKKSDTAKQYVQKWIPIVAASQSVKGKPEEKEFLLRWADVVDYE